MLDYTSLFAQQAQASTHVHFVYEVAAGQLVFVNDAYRAVLHGEPDLANTELPALLARLHPDDRPRLPTTGRSGAGASCAMNSSFACATPKPRTNGSV